MPLNEGRSVSGSHIPFRFRSSYGAPRSPGQAFHGSTSLAGSPCGFSASTLYNLYLESSAPNRGRVIVRRRIKLFQQRTRLVFGVVVHIGCAQEPARAVIPDNPKAGCIHRVFACALRPFEARPIRLPVVGVRPVGGDGTGEVVAVELFPLKDGGFCGWMSVAGFTGQRGGRKAMQRTMTASRRDILTSSAHVVDGHTLVCDCGPDGSLEVPSSGPRECVTEMWFGLTAQSRSLRCLSESEPRTWRGEGTPRCPALPAFSGAFSPSRGQMSLPEND